MTTDETVIPLQKGRTLRARLATSEEDVVAAQRLRFEVFNVELGEGLSSSVIRGRDVDPFDDVCDHILVECSDIHKPEEPLIVGTYRVQTGVMAKANLGYYFAQEFDPQPFEKIRDELLELGRACVHKDHRDLFVLGFLWRAIANYARERNVHYLCGCSSLTSQVPEDGAAVYAELRRNHLAPQDFLTQPTKNYLCPIDTLSENPPKIPRLLRAYLSLGAQICGPPALDTEFKTIDFLTLLDIHGIPGGAKRRYGL